MLFPDRLRSQYFFCAMSLMALGAHRGRPVAAAPCTPGLRPATSPLRGAFDLSLQASGRAEAASLQNTALSPHPCGLPRPSGNVSAMLRPPAPAVSAAPAPAVIWGCRPGKAQPPPGINAAPCLMASPGGAALTGPTRCEPVRGPGRPGKTPADTRRNIGATGNVPARAALSRATASMLLPGRLRSRLIVCVMAVMALGAHRGRPVAAAPCTPGLRPATSPLRGPFDLSLQASGRAEAASLQNTALSPHPCGLPRPSGNVSAMLRPPAPAVSAAPAPAVIWGCRPGKA